jgi:hypothetical protein
MDSKELREMSIQTAKLAVEQYQRLYRDLNMVYGGSTSPDEIIKELKEQNDMMDRIHYLDDAGFGGLTKMCEWIENTYSKYGYVSILGKQEFVNDYIQIIKKILVLRQYTDNEKQILNELRERYIKKDLGVDNSLPF